MDSNASKTGWDIFLFGIPLVAFLIFGFFRLDEIFASRKSQTPRTPSRHHAIRRKPMDSDPDGRPWDDA